MKSYPSALWLGLAMLCPTVPGQQMPNSTPPAGFVVRLEQFRAGKVIPVRPEHVFEANDYLRFRIQTPSRGYLYVVDQGTSGEFSVLFPSTATHGSNEIGSSPETFVPTPEDGWFQVGGPAGFDTVYFLLSPAPLAVGTAPSGNAAGKTGVPSNLLPRCNDAIFQARGECVDNNAGPTPLARGAALPPQITTAAPNASRDLFLADDRNDTVTAYKPLSGPVVYAFRIGHK